MSRLNDSTASTVSQDIMKQWLHQCNDHEDCATRQQPFLPTRLLDISGVDRTGKVRLVLSKDLETTTRYVTLSHCWGGEVPFLLTADTRDGMMKGSKLEDMPKTFQDAIAVARWANGESTVYIYLQTMSIILIGSRVFS